MKHYVVLFFILFLQIGFAQFTFNVTKTDETCVGNATLTFDLGNTNPNADYNFAIYKLPNTTTTYLVTTSTFVEYLSNGTYLIDAIETVNGNSTKITREITIDYLVEPLEYYIVEHITECNGITVEIVTIAGNPVSYEIFEGPTTYPLQESNFFNGLVTDQTYSIRIYDDCGEGYVRTHTIETETSFSFVFDGGSSTLVDCDTYRAYFMIYSESEVNGVEVTYTMTSDQGGVEVFTDNINISQGNSSVYFDFPFYSGEIVLVDISLLECSFSESINFIPLIDYQMRTDECGIIYFGLTLKNLLPPYTVEFNSYEGEEEFNPLDFNENHPLHYDDYILYGMMDNPLPFGAYNFTITDSCGHSETFNFESVYTEEDRILGFGNNGCGESSGYLIVRFNTDRTVVFAEITDGPEELAPFPLDVSEYINEDGDLRILDFPSGTYMVTILDSCGFEYEEEITIPELDLHPFSSRSYVNCQDLRGTLRFSTPNGGVLTQAVIIDAPEGFPYSLPYDATGDIGANGVLFYPDLPMGQYTIQATDSCDYNDTVTAIVRGDIFNTEPFIFVNKQCNIFDLEIDLSQTQYSFNPSYWLQYFDETSGEWVHPYTGVAYTGGTIPTEENSIKLIVTDEFELLNVGIFGNFRIVKTFKVITSDSPFRTEDCIKENYYTFDYHRDLTIVNAYRIICEGQNQAVVVQAQGVPPLNYYITTKNGEPFFIDNAEDNIFTNLEPAIYNFQVRDNCGNIRNREFNLNEVELMVSSGAVDNIVSCSEENQEYVEFYLPDKNIYLVASTLSLDYFDISYHLSFNQAYNDTNSLDDYYAVQQGQTRRIYARVENSLVSGCFSIAYFDLIVVETPDLSNIETDYVLCENEESVTISLPNIYDQYLWFDGSTDNSVVITQAGDYAVVVSNTEEGVVCEQEIVFTVTLSELPTIENIDFTDWTYTDNTITVNTSGNGNYVYSLNGVVYQFGATFENLVPGFYTVYVKDLNGCGETSAEVLLLNYPRFFTPNGDGFNEVWRIEFGTFEPEMRICIFDRYGKLIKVFMGDETGWDGTYNGKPLFSTDYWFTVERKNGIIKRGHFSMLR